MHNRRYTLNSKLPRSPRSRYRTGLLTMKLTCDASLETLILSWAIATLPTLPLSAQIVPDATLAEPSSVESGCAVCTIDGGVLRGTNLFHSFREFSIPTGGEAFFNNGLAIENIFSRVTGDSISNIDGLIRANGTANLFLLNPNGILFGPNAQLDIGGSFLGSTADAIGFGDNQFYSASNPEAPPLLTVNPSALFFDRASTGAIEVRSVAPAGVDVLDVPLVGLRVPDDRSLVLVGGEVSITGGNLNASGGRIELAGVASSGLVELSVNENDLSLSFPADLAPADISIDNSAFVNAGGENGGNVAIWGRNVVLTQGGRVSANTLGAGTAGSLTVSASESVQLIGISADGQDASGLFANPLGSGSGGDLTVTARQFLVQDGAQAGVGTFGEGPGGNFTITATESVRVLGESAINPNFFSNLFALTAGTGKAGNLLIETGQLVVGDGAQISAGTFGDGDGGNLTVRASDSIELIGTSGDGQFPSGLFVQAVPMEIAGPVGNAGDLTIFTRELIARDGASISASTLGRGDGGNLTVNASESVQLLGTSASGGEPLSGLFAQTDGPGNAGTLAINTARLLIRDGALASTATRGEGAGSAGELRVNASDWVQLIGTSGDGNFSSNLSTQTEGTGNASNLTITTGELIVRDGAQVGTGTFGEGDGGSLIVNADAVEVMGTSTDERVMSGLFASTGNESSGNGGSIEVNSATVTLKDRATIAVDSQGTGIGGTIDITADSLNLENEASILAETASTDGGNVQLQVGDLLFLSDESRISTTAGTAQAGGNGGDITISTPDGFIVARQNNDITANAFSGRGGNIEITAQSLFGIQPRNRLTDRSDITATSQLNTDGQINIDTPDIDPTQGLASLPEAPGVPETARGCDTGDGTGQFIDRGRGGLPTVPMEPLESNDILDDIQPPQGWENRESGAVDESDRLVEATGWTVDDNGRVVLVAENRVVRPDGCRG